MTLVGGVGLGLLALSLASVLLCGLVMVVAPALRLRRALRATEEVLEEYRQTVTAAQWALRETELERAVLLRPLRRVWRALTHPLVAALLESFSRRRRAARSGASA